MKHYTVASALTVLMMLALTQHTAAQSTHFEMIGITSETITINPQPLFRGLSAQHIAVAPLRAHAAIQRPALAARALGFVPLRLMPRAGGPGSATAR
jgi:hypothetical protein